MFYLTVDLYHDFNCIAGSCPNTCCAGWDINIDEAAYQKMLDNEEALGISVKDCIYKRTDDYCMRLKSDGRCPMLDENNLCKIVLLFGPDYLSYTCSSYPRRHHQYGNVTEAYLFPSCPDVIDKLMTKDKVYFDFTENNSPVSPYPHTKLYLYESSVRTGITELLYAFPNISLSTRLFVSFNIINEAISHCEGDNPDFNIVKGYIDSYYADGIMTSLDDQLQNMISEDNRYQFIPQFLSVLLNTVSAAILPDYIKLVRETLHYFSQVDSKQFLEDITSFKETIKPYDNFYTNYWVYLMFSELISIPDYSKTRGNFIYTCIQFCLIQMVALASYVQNKTLDKDKYIYITSVVNRMQHLGLRKKLIEQLGESNLISNVGILLLII